MDLSAYNSDLLNYARSLTDTEENAKDLLQDTYLKALETDNYEDRNLLLAWGKGIMYKVWQNGCRKNGFVILDFNDEKHQRLIADRELPAKSNKKPAHE